MAFFYSFVFWKVGKQTKLVRKHNFCQIITCNYGRFTHDNIFRKRLKWTRMSRIFIETHRRRISWKRRRKRANLNAEIRTHRASNASCKCETKETSSSSWSSSSRKKNFAKYVRNERKGKKSASNSWRSFAGGFFLCAGSYLLAIRGTLFWWRVFPFSAACVCVMDNAR